MKILFCWTDLSGYMSACWRAMAKSEHLEIFVIAFGTSNETSFGHQLMEEIPHQLLDAKERLDSKLIEKIIERENPDTIAVAGWFHPPYRNLPFRPMHQNRQFILCMDTPYWHTWRQKFAPLLLKPFIKKMDKVVVSGERSWQYARQLGFKSQDILKGQYGIDYNAFALTYKKRKQKAWPKNFLFVGRYNQVKAIDILVDAYQKYRNETIEQPWNLICCGKGPLEHLIKDQPGIINYGFVQPEDLRDIFVQAGCFVMPSRFDPWPLSIIEGCAAGLPVICTDVCGTSVELIKSWHNGFVIPAEDSDALKHAMLNVQDEYENLSQMGANAQQQAAPYTPQLWLKRWEAFLISKNKSEKISKRILDKSTV